MGHFSSVNVLCRSYESRYPLLPVPQPPLYETHLQERDTKYSLSDSLGLNFKDRVWLTALFGETNTPQHHPAACSQSDTGIRYRNEKLVAVMWNHFCTILSPKKDWKQH